MTDNYDVRTTNQYLDMTRLDINYVTDAHLQYYAIINFFFFNLEVIQHKYQSLCAYINKLFVYFMYFLPSQL